MQQQQPGYLTPQVAALAPFRWWRRPLFWLLFITPVLPLAILAIPRGMTLMDEPTDPWYTHYTTPVSLLVAFYAYPATIVSTAVGLQPLSAGWWCVALLYTALIGWGLCWLASGRPAAA